MRRALLLAALAGGPLLPPLRAWLEASMARHMLLAVPAALVAGWMLVPARGAADGSPWNPAGIPGFVLAAGGMTALMVPRLLDAAVGDVAIDAGKVLLAVGTGAAARWSWRASGVLVRAFVVGNAGWMLATVGVLLREAPERLCAVYLRGDQQRAGLGLVVGAVLLVAGWLATAPWRVADPDTGAPPTSPPASAVEQA